MLKLLYMLGGETTGEKPLGLVIWTGEKPLGLESLRMEATSDLNFLIVTVNSLSRLDLSCNSST